MLTCARCGKDIHNTILAELEHGQLLCQDCKPGHQPEEPAYMIGLAWYDAPTNWPLGEPNPYEE